MSPIKIKTELNNTKFVPGETLRGQVHWSVEGGGESAELRLFYFTSGRGTRDVEVVERLRWEQPGGTGEKAYSFKLPQGPYSFSGQLVSLKWALEFVLEPGTVTGRLEFVLSPTAEEINPYRYSIPGELDDESAAKKWLRAKHAQARGGSQ